MMNEDGTEKKVPLKVSGYVVDMEIPSPVSILSFFLKINFMVLFFI
jgi:hypothetical protein